MYCFRRTPLREAERQWFKCAGCGREIVRTVGLQPSDHTIQAEIEKILGVERRKT
jgi:hypothetical protein